MDDEDKNKAVSAEKRDPETLEKAQTEAYQLSAVRDLNSTEGPVA
jgi:hypothetical protein